MIHLFSEETRRNPYPLYAQMRSASPVLHVPPPFDTWMVFDYENVRRVVNDHEAFSSRVPAPDNWFIFFDPPQHTKMRALISRAFSPRSIVNLEPRIRDLSRELLDKVMVQDEVDFATEYSVPLPMMVIAEGESVGVAGSIPNIPGRGRPSGGSPMVLLNSPPGARTTDAGMVAAAEVKGSAVMRKRALQAEQLLLR